MVGTKRAKATFDELVALAKGAVTRPGFELLYRLVVGWVLVPGRRTITSIYLLGDPGATRAHDAYHRLVRCGRLRLESCWRSLVVVIVERLCPDGPLLLDLDDTLHHRAGPKVEGAGVFRDAVRSTKRKVVYAFGLNLVVVTLRVYPPWGGCPIGVPLGVRVHKKNGPTTTELARQIHAELAAWLPERSFHLTCDGAYATLCGSGLARTTVTSRVRRNASFYEKAPAQDRQAGTPTQTGEAAAEPRAVLRPARRL